jgi:hypothetical protein
MRMHLSPESKKRLFFLLKEKNKCKSIKELSKKLKIPKKTLQGWFYFKERTIPKEIIDKTILNEIKILHVSEKNWGQKKGGKKGYEAIIKKYGKERVKEINSKGGLKTAKKRLELEKPLEINLSNPIFLELYGSLLGDGWLSNFVSKGKRVWIIGLCGHISLDKKYLIYCNNNFERIFGRRGNFQEKPKTNTLQVIFRHKLFLKYLNEELDFPIGKKKNLKIHQSIYKKGYKKVKYVIKGIFDTDGSFHLSKSKKNPSPCISIHMKAPILIKQIGNILLKEGFKLSYSDHGTQIQLKGRIQLNKWMSEVGSSNSKHLNKIKKFLEEDKNSKRFESCPLHIFL